MILKLVRPIVLITVITFINAMGATAQNDTLSQAPVKKSKPKHNYRPGRAALLSTVLPGAGQFYNRRYWKPPIIYAGAAALAYWIRFNSLEYTRFHNAYSSRVGFRISNDPSVKQPGEFKDYSDNELKLTRDSYRRDLEFSIIISTAVYALNIVDAYVDAHLRQFDINEDISLSVHPLLYSYNYSQFAGGIKLNFTIK
ncbi:hypothetical protein MYP_2336 [Sporocytophaga myxococcoides]|uniref:DUF5683 domain-containing protein n=1 Tax=Sporocytophaga myxococcoides TaxID=153721 RepID=A0A098LG87_9BACT|nr:DUF5683 domain-containing protein [Sporocytophaga myxococcoides]GAL85108.1 hypothetical protein MYP_2336 [Sporocytophaga myxococcoides]